MMTSDSMHDMTLYKSVFLFLKLWKLMTRQVKLVDACRCCDVLLLISLVLYCGGVASCASGDSGSDITLLPCDDMFVELPFRIGGIFISGLGWFNLVGVDDEGANPLFMNIDSLPCILVFESTK